MTRRVCAMVIGAAILWSVSPSVRAAPQTGGAPRVENVRAEPGVGGAVNILYDLVGGSPTTRVTIRLEASADSGTTYNVQARSLTGDVGPNVAPGVGKRIVWDAANDVERVTFSQLRFRVLIADAGAPGAPPAIPARPSTGSVSVTSEPSGASVAIDGVARGRTPLTISDLAAGTHRVTITSDGYLENSREVRVEAGQTQAVQVTLTKGAGNQPSKGGSNKAKILIPVIAAAAVGGALAAMGGGSSSSGGGTTPPPTTPTTPTAPANRSPSIGSMSVTPATGLAQATSFSFTASATDPDNDPLTYSWDVNGTGFSGPSGSATFSTAGTGTFRVTVTDGRGGSATDSRTATVTSMTGTWSFNIPTTGSLSITLTQTALNNVNGTFVVSPGGFGAASAGTTGRTDPAEPGTINANGNVRIRLKVGAFTDFVITGVLNAAGNALSPCNTSGSGFTGQNCTMTK